MADPYEIAREALRLAEKATPGPMWADDTGHLRYASRDGIDDADIATFWTDDEREREDAPFFAHAGTHYAAVCRALLAQRAVVEAAVHDEGRCDECGGANEVWFADNALWNENSGGVHFLCPVCFMRRCRRNGVKCTGWQLVPENYIPANRSDRS